MSANQGAELDALRAQVARLQVEKNDLVAMNSELQLKADQDSQDDSFIEVIRVSVKICKHAAQHFKQTNSSPDSVVITEEATHPGPQNQKLTKIWSRSGRVSQGKVELSSGSF